MKKLSYDVYLDKVLGGWYGKSIGGVIATQVEGVRELMDFTERDIWPEVHPANDDLTMQVMFLEVLEEKGVYFEQMDLVRTWIERCSYPFGEYGYFRRNYRKGIYPPVSPTFDNPIKEFGMGCPIRSEIWGMVCPGDPKLAGRLCTLDGSIDHTEQSVAGEQMWSGLESELFFETDTRNLRKLIEKHRTVLPKGSKIADAVGLTLQFYDEGLKVEEARRRLLARMGEPDQADSRQNVALTVMALLYGEGDFKKTALQAMNLGYDTDCTTATALAILGLIYGFKRLPADWIEKNTTNYVCNIEIRSRDDRDLRHLAERTARAALGITRSRSKACRITNVPDGVEPVPMDRPEPRVRLEWDYRGIPSMAIGDTRDMRVVIKNETGTAVSGKLTVRGPHGWKIEVAAKSVTVPARGRKSVPVRLAIPAGAKEIAQANHFRVRFAPSRGKAVSEMFGVSGAWPWQVMGLFFDAYDRIEFPKVTWDRGRWGKKYRSTIGRHYFADLGIKYVKEGNFDYRRLVADGKKLLGDGATAHAHTVEVPVNDITRQGGEFCVYLLGNVVSDVARTIFLFFGHNDAIKVWLNGKPVMEDDGKKICVPADRGFKVKLKKGLNRVVIKTLRRSECLRLAVAFKESTEGKYPGSHEWTWDLTWRAE